jgi:hypothetical protein
MPDGAAVKMGEAPCSPKRGASDRNARAVQLSGGRISRVLTTRLTCPTLLVTDSASAFSSGDATVPLK